MLGGIHELETYLKTAEIESVTVWPYRSTRASYQVLLIGGVHCIAKPTDEVAALECNFEVAAWIVARDLGWPDLVATTVFREMPSQRSAGKTAASLQVVWPRNDRGPDLGSFDDDERWRAAIFDGLVAHTDRNDGNYLGVPAAAAGVRSRLKLVDHGIAFTGGESNSRLYTDKRGQAIPEKHLQAIQHWRSGHMEELSPYLQPDHRKAIADRADKMLQSKSLSVT